jgi:hypothetical protein
LVGSSFIFDFFGSAGKWVRRLACSVAGMGEGAPGAGRERARVDFRNNRKKEEKN